MASEDGSRSLQGASDEAFLYECGPCKSDDTTRKAKHYCYTCSEHICADCMGYHRKFKEMRDHKIISGPEMPKHGLAKQPTVPGIKCGCNQNFVESFCDDHNDVICRACHTVKHRKCKTIAVRNKCSQSSGYQPGSVLKKAKSLETDIENLKRTGQAEISSVEKMTDDCRSQIKTYRSKLTELLDKLELNLLKGMDTAKTEHNQTVDHQISSLTTTLQMLQADCKTLVNLERNGPEEAIFAAEIKVSMSLKDYETVMFNIAKEVKKCSISFEQNTQLEALLKETNLGNLKISEAHLETTADSSASYTRGTIRPVILDMKKVSSTSANVKLPDDENTPNIEGCAFLSNGKLLLTDSTNYKVKLLDRSFAFEDSLVLPSRPQSITALDDGSAIVALPYAHTLLYIHITPKLKLGRTVPVDGKCYSVAVVDDELFVSCCEMVKVI